jgi:pantoate--beta-alanine ligase
MTRLVRSRADLAAARAELSGAVAVVLTMGALHEGHRELMRAARAHGGHLLVTIFVNPLQFGPHEDFDRYPRTLDADLEICRGEGVDVVFAPEVDEMYPGGLPAVRIEAGRLGEVFEGASRPGHFTGVLTVVCKLLLLTRADVTFFGEKDFQQLALVKRMVRDLNLPVEVRAVPTVREPDGLAKSSRNSYLTPVEREAALVLSRALRAGAEQTDAGPGRRGPCRLPRADGPAARAAACPGRGPAAGGRPGRRHATDRQRPGPVDRGLIRTPPAYRSIAI